MECLQSVIFLSGAEEQDRLSRDLSGGKSRAASGVAVHLRHDDPVDIQPLVEALGRIDGVLSGQRVYNEKDLVRFDPLFDIGKLCHQILIDLKPSCRIYDQYIISLALCLLLRGECDLHRVFRVAVRIDRRMACLADHFQLVDGCGPVHVAGGKHGFLPAFLEIIGKLAAGRRLTCTLKSRHHNGGKTCGAVRDLGVLPAHELCQLLVDDLYDLLCRRQALHNF